MQVGQRPNTSSQGQYPLRGFAIRPVTASRQAIVTRFLRVSAKVGRTVTAYPYRHTWATRALAAGIPDTHVAALLGHASTAMVHKHYSHVDANARLLRELVDKLASCAAPEGG
jgi:integrase